MAQKYGLGRGLASLIPPKKIGDSEHKTDAHADAFGIPKRSFSSDTAPSLSSSADAPVAPLPPEIHHEPLQVPLDKISRNPHQPRLHFDEAKLEELALSIREHGILQPLTVSREEDTDRYELIAGERRFQAAKKAGLATVPVLVRAASEQEKLELAIIENIQRHDLNPIEEAKAFLRLIDEFGLQQESVAAKMGQSRSSVANKIRLLHLPIEVQRAVIEGKISEGHAKALLSIENPEKQRAVFELIIKEELTVRETESKVRETSVKAYERSAPSLHPELARRMEGLSQALGTKVKIAPSGKGGKVIIEYYSTEELDGLLKKFGQA